MHLNILKHAVNFKAETNVKPLCNLFCRRRIISLMTTISGRSMVEQK